MFEYIKGYSPVHNAKVELTLSTTMVTTGDHDDKSSAA
jgi:prolyl oligopeptidase